LPESAFLQTAIDIVTGAGEIQLARQGSGFRISKKGTTDLVTEVDLECERMCREILAQRFPDHEVLAEEGGASQTRGSRWRWVFDPLDGTTNYAHGLPIFSASLGLEIDGRTEVGAVYDPSRRELFTAERGQGARLNGVPLKTTDTAALIDGLLVTGFPYGSLRTSRDLLEIFGAFILQSRAVRRLGSAALDLCYVAAGRFDAFWEQHLKHWDVCAGILIAEEAGGRVTGMDGTPFDPAAGHLIASNGPLHDEMLRVIREYRAGGASSRTGVT
jgi:myo-inositol-1(or 4)-monophosphatase